jgi:hypothetical protein
MRFEFLAEVAVMRCKEADTPDMASQVVQNGVCHCNPVIRTRPPAQFIEDDQRIRRRLGEDLFRFSEFDHECRGRGKDVVVCTETGHDSVDGGHDGATGGDVAAYLGHNDGDARLSQ